MRRVIPEDPPPPDSVKPVRERLIWNIPVRVVTPIYGGGTEKGQPDQMTPISAKAIRGHLRSWWRLCFAPGLDNPTGLTDRIELQALREEEIFGSTAWPSPFDLIVSGVRPASPQFRDLTNRRQPYGFPQGSPELYALFPALESPERPNIWREGIEFVLSIKWSDDRTSVLLDSRSEENKGRRRAGRPLLPDPLPISELQSQTKIALGLWLSFGGFGGRTRRGLGAVSCSSDPTSVGIALIRPADLLRLVPIAEIYCARTPSVPMSAWRASLDVYRRFRQMRGPKTSRTALQWKEGRAVVEVRSDIEGRSRWPEPDSIRDITGCSLKPGPHVINGTPVTFNDHSRHFPVGDLRPAFPRAVLGLPINFHFADGPNFASRSDLVRIADRDRDPDKPLELRPVGSERMASPVLTRPILINDMWHAGIIIFRFPHLQGLEAELKHGKHGRLLRRVSANEIQGPALGSVSPLRGQTNALEALAAFAIDQQFEKLGGAK